MDKLVMILIIVLLVCVATMLVILAIGFRARWYLIQHLNEPRHVWAPAKLWGLPGMAPLCFMLFRVWGPFGTEDEAVRAAVRAYDEGEGHDKET